MRANPVESDTIEFARKHDLYVYQTMLTGQYRTRRDGGTAITGPCNKRHAKELRDFLWNWTRRVHKANAKLIAAEEQPNGQQR